MLEGLVHRKQDHDRLSASPAGEYLGSFAEMLVKRGYRRRTVVRYVFAADRVSRWLQRRGQTVQQLDNTAFSSYLAELGRRRRGKRMDARLPTTAPGALRFLEFLRQQGVTPAPITPAATETDRWVALYDDHLDRVAGLSVGTRRCYCRYARALIARCLGERASDFAALTADALADFVREVAGKLKPSSCRLPATAARALVRFLVSQGVVRPGIDGAIPAVRQWKHASLPKAITPDEVERVLSLCGSETDLAIRDRAVLLLLARLALRAGEVATLEIEHLRWTRGEILVVAGKSGRDRVLPLSDEVGQALAAHLRRRPRLDDRHVFLTAMVPYRPLAPSSVSALASRHLRRAGLPQDRRGAHVLRHTAASHMVRRGASFKDVADVLGHARLETTGIYAKLDLDALSRLAMPWPGGGEP